MIGDIISWANIEGSDSEASPSIELSSHQRVLLNLFDPDKKVTMVKVLCSSVGEPNLQIVDFDFPEDDGTDENQNRFINFLRDAIKQTLYLSKTDSPKVTAPGVIYKDKRTGQTKVQGYDDLPEAYDIVVNSTNITYDSEKVAELETDPSNYVILLNPMFYCSGIAGAATYHLWNLSVKDWPKGYDRFRVTEDDIKFFDLI